MIVWSAPVDDLGNWRYRQFKKKSERENDTKKGDYNEQVKD